MLAIPVLQQQIIFHSLFQKLKNIEEYFPGYHEHETTYDHLLKTARIAEDNIDGHFITNPLAKERFLELVHQKMHGTDLQTIMILTALLHDAGKLLLYKESGKTKPLRVVDEQGFTPFPGHPFWGGRLVVPEILQDIDLTPGAKQMIADIVKVHNAYEEPFFTAKKGWTLERIISEIKSGATGYYEEALFNLYCDCYTATPFAFGKNMIEKIFNDPAFYNKRLYLLP